MNYFTLEVVYFILKRLMTENSFEEKEMLKHVKSVNILKHEVNKICFNVFH